MHAMLEIYYVGVCSSHKFDYSDEVCVADTIQRSSTSDPKACGLLQTVTCLVLRTTSCAPAIVSSILALVPAFKSNFAFRRPCHRLWAKSSGNIRILTLVVCRPVCLPEQTIRSILNGVRLTTAMLLGHVLLSSLATLISRSRRTAYLSGESSYEPASCKTTISVAWSAGSNCWLSDAHYADTNSRTSYTGHTYLYKAVVPHIDTSNSASSTLETTLMAKTTVCFPAGVRFQRSSRYSIKLSVVIQPELPQNGSTSLRQTRQMDTMSPESKLLFKHYPTRFRSGTDGAKQETGRKSDTTGPRFPSFANWSNHSTIGMTAPLEEQNDIVTSTDVKLEAQNDDSLSKRTEKTRMQRSPHIIIEPSRLTPSALHGLDDEGSLELRGKQQHPLPNGTARFTSFDTTHSNLGDKVAAFDTWTDRHMDGS